jgi:glucose-6-phosphate-specific signal transduction histidine kinase
MILGFVIIAFSAVFILFICLQIAIDRHKNRADTLERELFRNRHHTVALIKDNCKLQSDAARYRYSLKYIEIRTEQKVHQQLFNVIRDHPKEYINMVEKIKEVCDNSGKSFIEDFLSKYSNNGEV